MNDRDPAPGRRQTSARPVQYPLQLLFWAPFNVGMALAYLRGYGHQEVLYGLAVAGGAAVLGWGVGWPLRRAGDGLYWALLGALFAFLSALEVPPMLWAWSALGAAAGAVVGAVSGGRPVRTAVAGALAGTGAFAVVLASQRPPLGTELRFDIVCAVVISGMFGALVEVFWWLERRASLPRYVTASVLLLAVIVGNLLARR